MPDIKYIDIKEFRDLGFLQEVNRQFFHPLGLALEVLFEDDGTESLGGVWDYRDDPEGMIFSEGVISHEKMVNVEAERVKHVLPRRQLFDSLDTIQHADWKP